MSHNHSKSKHKHRSEQDVESSGLLEGGEQLYDNDDQQAIQDAIDRQARMRQQMGRQVNFDDLQDENYQATCYYNVVVWIVDVVILAIIIVILEFFKRNGNKCGISLLFWIEIFFVILLTQTTMRLNYLWWIRCFRDMWSRFWFIAVIVLIWWLFLSAWTIYGYIIYSSDDNDCQNHSDTTAWLIIMILCLFWGQVIMILLFCALTCGPFVYCWIRNQMDGTQGPLDGNQVNQVISGLSKVGYNQDQFKDERCIICLMDFEAGDELTQLKCDHYFHHECLAQWIKQGKNSCPSCRKDIEDVEDLRNMLEGGCYEYMIENSDEQSQKRSSRAQQNIAKRYGNKQQDSRSEKSSKNGERCKDINKKRKTIPPPKSSAYNSGSSDKS